MTPDKARELLKRILFDPEDAARVGNAVMDQVEKALPAILTGTGTYLLSEMLGKAIGLEAQSKKPAPPALPPITINVPTPSVEYKTAGGSVGEQIEPPENWMSWQKRQAQGAIDEVIREKESRNILRNVLRKA